MLTHQIDTINRYSLLIDEKIEESRSRLIFHNKSAEACSQWDSFLSICGLILNSSNALAMTVMTVSGTGPIPIAVVSATISFSTVVLSKIRDSYNFNLLKVLHNHASDSYLELEYEFGLLKLECQKQCLSIDEYEKTVIKFMNTGEKSHIQEVKCCKFFCLLR